jgi:hypothetical protein
MTICMVGFYEIYTGMTIASSILYALGIWILLFVVVYRLNIMLREHLGSLTKEHKVGSLIITAVLLIITIVQFSLQSYYNTAQLSRWDRTIDIRAILKLVQKVLVAKNVLYLVAVLISGAASLMSIIAMRSNQLPGGVCSLHIHYTYGRTNGASGSYRLGNSPLYLYVHLDTTSTHRIC